VNDIFEKEKRNQILNADSILAGLLGSTLRSILAFRSVGFVAGHALIRNFRALALPATGLSFAGIFASSEAGCSSFDPLALGTAAASLDPGEESEGEEVILSFALVGIAILSIVNNSIATTSQRLRVGRCRGG